MRINLGKIVQLPIVQFTDHSHNLTKVPDTEIRHNMLKCYELFVCSFSVIRCKEFRHPSNASMKGDISNKIYSKRIYKCKNGYHYSDGSIIIPIQCTSKGQWTRIPDDCKGTGLKCIYLFYLNDN